MSTFRYYNGASAFGTKGINWLADTIRGALVNSLYSALPTDKFVTDIPAEAIVARSDVFTGNAINKGVCSGLCPEFDALVGLADVVGFVIFKDTGTDSTSPLIYFSSDGIGFPFLPGGINYFVTYDQANGGWFQL